MVRKLKQARSITALALALAAGCDSGLRPDETASLIPSQAQTAVVREEASQRCWTETPSRAQLAAIEQSVARAQTELPTITSDGLTVIPVYFHVLRNDYGYGNVTDDLIREQLDVLNASFDGGSGGANMRFEFSLKAITRTDKTYWFSYCHAEWVREEMMSALRSGGRNALNIYSADPSFMLGMSALPWNYDENPTMDGVIVRFRTLPGGAQSYHDEGDTLVHEVGHWLGLLHTFQDGCEGGDQVADTASEAEAAFGCPLTRDTCEGGGSDPIYNFMNYTDDACMYEFTRGQSVRARVMYGTFRDPAVTRIAAARREWRNKRILLR